MDFQMFRKLFLFTVALQQTLMGVVCFFDSAAFKSQAYDPLKSIMSIQAWGLVYLVLAGLSWLCFVFRRNTKFTKGVGVLNVTVLGFWASNFVGAVLSGHSQGPTGAITWSVLVIYNLLMLATAVPAPLRTVPSAPHSGIEHES